MRTKPNKYKNSVEDSHWTHNDLYRRFRREFDLILQGDTPCINDTSFSLCYVKNKNIEDKLNYIKNSNIDSIQFLIGRTGIGKSTILRYIFKTSRKPIILENDSLVVPFSFNGMKMSETDYEAKLGAIVRTASKLLYKEYSIEFSDQEFSDFVNDHAPDVLLRGTVDIRKSDTDLLNEFRLQDQYSFALEEFKFYLSKTHIKRTIFVIDDIESESQIIQEKIIESICRLYSCIKNYQSRNSYINVLFSVRPVTEKLARKNRSINAFPISRPVILKKPIPLNELFEVRMNYSISDIGKEHITDIQSWNDALDALLLIVDQLSDRYGYGLLRLFNNNIRRTLIEFQLLITNRIWLQRKELPKPSFKIRTEGFSINNASIFRSLGMRNGIIYPAEGSCLVNIFCNKPEKTYDLLIIYIILYLLERNEGNEYLDTIIDTVELQNNFKKIFIINEIQSVIEQCFDKMESLKLVEREVSNGGSASKEFITLQPRAQQLWNILGESSVLFEMYRDDTYQVFKGRNKRLSTMISADELFDEVFNFLDEIYNWEHRYVDTFRINDPEFASRLFGGTCIFSHILSGIKHSLYAYFRDGDDIPDHLKQRLTQAHEKIDQLLLT